MRHLHIYLRFVFMIVSMKTWSFEVALKSLSELSLSLLSICLLRLPFNYHYPIGKILWSVLMLRLILWLGFIEFVMHWHLDLHFIWPTWPLVSWKYIVVMVKSFFQYDTYVCVFITIGLLIIWIPIGTLVKLLIWVVTILWRMVKYLALVSNHMLMV